MKKQILTGAVIFALLIAVVLMTLPGYRWLIFNGNAAKAYAVNLLAGNNQKTPDWAIDLIAIKENRMVIFSEHNSERMYAFSPESTPSKEGISWSHMWGSWYVGTTKT